MKFTNKKIAISSIRVDRKARMRKDLKKLSDEYLDMKSSIEARGLINPITVCKDPEGQAPYLLLAGETRLEIHKDLGHTDIACRIAPDNSEETCILIEADENFRRRNLTWQETAEATYRIHQLLSADPDWTAEQTAQHLNVSPSFISMNVRAGSQLADGNERVRSAQTLNQAMTAMDRQASSDLGAIALALENSGLEDEPEEVATPKSTTSETPHAPTQVKTKTPEKKELRQGNFLEWVETYEGPKYNVIHCDFPFGIGMDKSTQQPTHYQKYSDSPDVYFHLLEAFVANYHKFAARQSHIFFWFSYTHYRATVEALARIPNAFVLERPAIWAKTGNKGLVPDYRRRFRQTYETALLVSVGDAQLLHTVSDSYVGAVDSSRLHEARKPLPMLEHFFKAFVDSNTHLFDPTAGSGAALQAAHRLGAAKVRGLELSQSHVDRFRLEVKDAG